MTCIDSNFCRMHQEGSGRSPTAFLVMYFGKGERANGIKDEGYPLGVAVVL